MTDTTTHGPGEHGSRATASSGTMLRDAREAAGLTLDMVAQQLKLAPRQVIALEEGDYGSLPGRTFVRGFVRNYARLLNIDADHVLAGLPASDTDALHPPVLHPTAPTIGDLPTEDKIKPGWARWAIPVALVVVIASGVAYEFTRGRSESRQATATPVTEPEPKATIGQASPPPTPTAEPVPPSSPVPPASATGHTTAPAATTAPTSPAVTGTPASPPAAARPTPLPPPASPASSSAPIGTTTPASAPVPRSTTTAPTPPAAPAMVPLAPPATTPATAAPTAASAAPPAARSTTATSTAPPAPPPPSPRTTPLSNPFANPLSNPFAGATPAAPPPAPAVASGNATMVLTLRKSSRAEVKDATGRMVFSETVPAGQTRTITGTPPFDVVISNATEATLTYRGRQIDIGPYTRQKVARFRLL